MHKLILKPGREKSLQRRHPWIFSGGVARVEGNPQAGEAVEVRSADGVPLAVAAYSPQSQIRARVWDWTVRDIDAAFIARRIAHAAAGRSTLLAEGSTDAVRLIPRMKEWIAAELPGTKLAITEYSWGNDDGLSSALAQAAVPQLLTG